LYMSRLACWVCWLLATLLRRRDTWF